MFVDVNSKNSGETKEVTYLGATVDIPANHNWVAVILMAEAFGGKYLLASFANEPVLSKSGIQYVPVGEFSIITEVEALKPEELIHTLRQVDGDMDVSSALYSNIEELVYKVKHVLSQDASREEKLHEIFCPEQGIFPEFMDYAMPQVLQLFVDNEGKEPTPVANQAPDVAVKPTLGALLTQAFEAASKGESDTKDTKPRIRVLHASSIDEAVELIKSNLPS